MYHLSTDINGYHGHLGVARELDPKVLQDCYGKYWWGFDGVEIGTERYQIHTVPDWREFEEICLHQAYLGFQDPAIYSNCHVGPEEPTDPEYKEMIGRIREYCPLINALVTISQFAKHNFFQHDQKSLIKLIDQILSNEVQLFFCELPSKKDEFLSWVSTTLSGENVNEIGKVTQIGLVDNPIFICSEPSYKSLIDLLWPNVVTWIDASYLRGAIRS